MQISFFNGFAYSVKSAFNGTNANSASKQGELENTTLSIQAVKQDEANAGVKANSTTNSPENSSDEEKNESKTSILGSLKLAEEGQKANEAEDSLDRVLEILYQKLEELQKELKELNSKALKATSQDEKLEFMNQAQVVMVEIQSIMAQIIKLLRAKLE